MSDNIICIPPQLKRYVKAVERKLRLPRKVKARVISDFTTTITARFEQGESCNDIMASLGSPAEAAAQLNEQMKEYSYSRSKWRFACLAAALPPVAWLLFQALVPAIVFAVSFPTESASIGIIGGADGPTSILVTSPIISFALLWKVAAAILIAAAAIWGFWRLGHIKNKQ